jgi:hypothetical protein
VSASSISGQVRRHGWDTEIRRRMHVQAPEALAIPEPT